MANTKPNTAEGAVDIADAREKAAVKLLNLFGGETADGKTIEGVLHQHAIETLEAADPGWKQYIDGVRKNPHAKTLAMVMSCRGNDKFPPALVAALFSDEEVHGANSRQWFTDVFLGGLAEIFRQTNGKVGVILPPNQSGLDMARAAYNVVSHLTPEERERLNLYMPDESPRRQLATDLTGILAENNSFTFTPVQQLYRWAVNKREEQRDRDGKYGGKDNKSAEDPTGVLPPPPGTSEGGDKLPRRKSHFRKTNEATGPAAPEVPDQTALTKPNGEDKGGVAPLTLPPPPVPTQTPDQTPVKMPAPPLTAVPPAATGENTDDKLILDLLSVSDDLSCKAMATLVKAGKRTTAQATELAKRLGLFN